MVCSPPPLDSNTLHVWSAPLDTAQDVFENLTACLTPDERGRAERFRFDRDRRRFSVARAVLRHTLGAYLHRAPRQVHLLYGPHGKPRLHPEENMSIEFNLAHSGPLALIALARGRAVGIDLERIRPELVTEQLAVAALSSAELDFFRRLPSERRVSAFFSMWTRKEAYLKARGVGIAHDLDKIEVTTTADFDALSATGEGGSQRLDGWLIYGLATTACYAAAVAVASDASTQGKDSLRRTRRDASVFWPRRAIEPSAANDIACLQVLHVDRHTRHQAMALRPRVSPRAWGNATRYPAESRRKEIKTLLSYLFAGCPKPKVTE
jgi:4'-phosphopantetheinyl transferase